MTSPPTRAATTPSNANATSPSSPPHTPLLLLKTRNTPTDAYATYFSAPRPGSVHLHPTFIPVLHHTFHPPSLTHLRALLSLPAPAFPYGGLICTSQRAVEALARALDDLATDANGEGAPPAERHDPTAPPGGHGPGTRARTPSALALPLYTVGPATARALSALQARHLPRCGVHGRETGDGARLAAYILAHYAPPPRAAPVPGSSPPRAGTPTTDTTVPLFPPPPPPSPLPLLTTTTPTARPPLLFLVGEQRRDIIPSTLASPALAPARRVRVDELVVYATRVEEGFAGALERELGREGAGPVWVVVFSPTGCAEMVRALRGRGAGADVEREGEGRREVLVASIGPTTRDYLGEEFGFRVDVCAERPSPEGLAEGIARFMRERGS
ncbi:hypothetical protein MMC15_008207 [Xylographa vitiligo]|nr:hypothetical protein [Xylographa vitiligo]